MKRYVLLLAMTVTMTTLMAVDDVYYWRGAVSHSAKKTSTYSTERSTSSMSGSTQAAGTSAPASTQIQNNASSKAGTPKIYILDTGEQRPDTVRVIIKR